MPDARVSRELSQSEFPTIDRIARKQRRRLRDSPGGLDLINSFCVAAERIWDILRGLFAAKYDILNEIRELEERISWDDMPVAHHTTSIMHGEVDQGEEMTHWPWTDAMLEWAQDHPWRNISHIPSR